jgi:hypothetical protein
VESGPSDRALPPPPHPARKLRAAFTRHSRATGYSWAARITVLPAPGQDVRLELADADANALADLLLAAAELASSGGRRGPNWSWIGSAEAARRIGVKPSTVRAWVAVRGPRNHPFPRPDQRIKGHNLWRPKTVDKWNAEHTKQATPEQEPDRPQG